MMGVNPFTLLMVDQPKNDVQNIVGKITLTPFNGLAMSSIIKWVYELDTYFTLNPMRVLDAIRYAPYNLDGDAMALQYCRTIPLGHIGITYYREFRRRLIERFD